MTAAGRWIFDFPVPLRRASGCTSPPAAVSRTSGLLRRAAARSAPADPGDLGVVEAGLTGRLVIAGVGGAGHPRLPAGVVLAFAPDRPRRLDLAPRPLRQPIATSRVSPASTGGTASTGVLMVGAPPSGLELG